MEKSKYFTEEEIEQIRDFKDFYKSISKYLIVNIMFDSKLTIAYFKLNYDHSRESQIHFNGDGEYGEEFSVEISCPVAEIFGDFDDKVDKLKRIMTNQLKLFIENIEQ